MSPSVLSLHLFIVGTGLSCFHVWCQCYSSYRIGISLLILLEVFSGRLSPLSNKVGLSMKFVNLLFNSLINFDIVMHKGSSLYAIYPNPVFRWCLAYSRVQSHKLILTSACFKLCGKFFFKSACFGFWGNPTTSFSTHLTSWLLIFDIHLFSCMISPSAFILPNNVHMIFMFLYKGTSCFLCFFLKKWFL